MLKKSYQFLLFGNIYVAVAVSSFMISSCLLLDMRIFFEHIAFAFFSTLASYNLARVYSVFIHKSDIPSDRMQWGNQNKLLVLVLFVISIIGTGVSFLFLNYNAKLLVSILSIISIFYSVPFGKKNLRQLSVSKIFLIALSWAVLSIYLPATENEFNLLLSVILCLANFAFIVSITIPFDIRDMKQDMPNELQTLPILLGIKKSMQLMNVLHAFYIAVTIYVAFQFHQSYLAFAHLTFFFIASFVLSLKEKFEEETYCLFFIDGLPILQLVLIVIWFLLYDETAVIKFLSIIPDI